MRWRAIVTGLLLAWASTLAPARADHMSPWGQGHANMPNDIHNTRFETLGTDNDAFITFVREGLGAETVNRCLLIDCPEAIAATLAAVEAAVAAVELVARLDPLPAYQGRGQARYKLFEDERAVARLLRVNVRLRLLRGNGAPANAALGLSEADAASTAVTAYLSRDIGGDERAVIAACALPFEAIEYGDDGIADYATYALALKEDADGLLEVAGRCIDASATPVLPAVAPGDLVDVGVLTPVLEREVVPVLMGAF